MCLVISVFLPIWDNNHRTGGKKAWEGRKEGCFGCWTR